MDEYIPQLTLTPDLNAQPQPEVKQEADLITKAQAAPEAGPDLSALSEQEQQAVLAFSKQIDLENAQQILEYGASAQKNIADFSDTALAKVKTGDLGEIGDMLSGLLVELKTMDEPEKKGIAGLFRKAKINAEEMKSRFATAEVNVDRISGELEKHKITLLKDVAVMDQMYERNLQYFKELTMYILAGKQKLAEARSTTLHELRAKAEASNLPEDAQAANDFENKCVRFEKKLHDLELTRMISLQTAPQIRMIQNNDTALVEKIQTSVLNTIPLWKNQMVLALGLAHSQQAMQAERAVTEPDGADARHRKFPPRHGGSAAGHGHDERAAAEERRYAAYGLRRDGEGIRARHRRHGNAQAHQRAADLHARRGPADPDRRRKEAAGGRG